MNEIIGSLVVIFTSILGFFLGQYAERRKQSLYIRSEMLKPIEEWLSGAEKFIGIFGDTLTSAQIGSPLPLTYNLEERRKAAQFMTEKTNLVFGILYSESLKTWQTRKFSKELGETINSINGVIRTRLLPMDNEIMQRAKVNALNQEFILEFGKVKLGLTDLCKKHIL